MIPVDYEQIRITEDKIVYQKSGKTLVYFKDVIAIGYKKNSFLHWLSMKYDWMAIGILYIAKKDSKKVKDLIPIYMPLNYLKKMPKNWYNTIEFYSIFRVITLHRIIQRL